MALASASRRLIGDAARLVARAHDAVDGSRHAIEASRHALRARHAWNAIWSDLRSLPRHQRVITVCCFCYRVRRLGGGWVTIPYDIIHQLQRPEGPIAVSHGMCPPCVEIHYSFPILDTDY